MGGGVACPARATRSGSVRAAKGGREALDSAGGLAARRPKKFEMLAVSCYLCRRRLNIDIDFDNVYCPETHWI